MVRSQKYNGWTNKETWLVSLWLNNEEDLYHRMMRILRDEKDNVKAGEALQEMLEEPLLVLPGYASDLISAAFARVNWREIARDSREN